jgi:hypothetical protein
VRYAVAPNASVAPTKPIRSIVRGYSGCSTALRPYPNGC